ncbi:sugar transferase [Cellulomonas telluris]|uniref:sugar transferase n=1 Tax=Cellulomonas telluris TaxID=2306636 RepID=UPI0010A8FAD8|nr:sugar transferase [Cellulomonas telluris]
MSILEDPSGDAAVFVDRRRPSGGPRISWASATPYVEHPREPLAALDADNWATASAGYARRVALGDLLVAAVVVPVLVVVCAPYVRGEPWWALVAVAAFLALVALFRGYDRRSLGSGAVEYQAVLRAGVGSAAAVAIGGVALGELLPRGLVAATVLTLTAGSLVARHVQRRRLHRRRTYGAAMARTVVVGDAASVHHVIADLRGAPHHGYRVVGVCLPSIQDVPPQDGAPTLGALADIPQVAFDHRVDVVIVTGSELSGEALRRLSWALGRMGVDLVVAPGLVEVLGPRIQLRPTAGLSLLSVETQAPRRRMLAKSALDRALGALLLLGALPVVLAAALAVRLSSPGPAFFRQERIGVDGRAFTLWKLRSMYVDAEARRAALLGSSDRDGLMFKMHRDPRITPVGRLLRRYSVDELPQLWNVVRGDMSLVGPRPPLPSEVAEYEDAVFRRLRVRPGLTGLWQVSGRADLSWEESVRLDLRYVDNWSVAMDLLILWKTGRAVFGGSGAY